MNNNAVRIIFFIFLLTMLWTCAYYNTMFNALEYYKSGIEKLEKSQDNQITSDIQKDFNAAIDKSWKLINIYSDSNSYADDALLLIGKSHYQMQQFTRSERFLRQFVSRYPESDLLAEAKLWLARSLIELDREDEAIEELNELLEEDVSNQIKSLTLFSLGDLYGFQQNFDLAITYLNQCVEQSDDDKLSARAVVRLGDIYREQADYVNAIEVYSRIKEYDAPILTEFEALSNKVMAQLKLLKYEETIRTLRSAANESRFNDFLPDIEARIGEIYKIQNDIEAAERQFLFILEKYPRTEGAASAAFWLAELTQKFNADPDSARNLYLRVGKESRTSEYLQEAANRASLLQTYIKLKQNIDKDLKELASVTEFDSLLESETDTIDSTETSVSGVPKANSSPKRTEEEIRKSLQKDKLILAEFFLLNMQEYDSARVAYSDLITTDADSSLKIKAYYALYYLNKFHFMKPTVADSVKRVIVSEYPESEYAEFFRSQNRKETVRQDTIDIIKQKYLNAENLLFNNDYSRALRMFNEIAIQDSGSSWAEKSRYAIAWIYENKLKDTGRAIKAYSAIVDEYPQTEYAKIARNKIKDPPPEPDSLATAADTTDVKSLPEKEVKSSLEKRVREGEPGEPELIQDTLKVLEENKKSNK